jgi:hypothetical protein
LTKEQEEEQARLTTAATERKVENDSTIDDFTGEGVTDEEMEAHGATDVVVQDVGPEIYESERDEVVDLTGTPEERQDREAPKVEERPTEVLQSATEIVRPREDCHFIMGAGNLYTFSAGRAAKVPKHVADHMREKGLIWD